MVGVPPFGDGASNHPAACCGGHSSYLHPAYRLSDQAVVARWVENPCYQHLTGETFFQHRSPIDPSSLTRWRNRIGEEGVEWLLTQREEELERPRWGVSLTNEAGRRSGAIDDASLQRVAVDTTVMEKAIAHPTDARLYERARVRLVVLAQEAGMELRQSYARLAPRLAMQGRPPCPCQTVPPPAQGIEETERLHRQGHAGPAPSPR